MRLSAILPVLLLAAVLPGHEAWVPAPHVHPLLPSIRAQPANPVAVEGVEVELTARDQVVRTMLTVHVRNRGPTRAEAVLLLPLPGGAAVRSFGFQGPGGELEARLLPADEARATYQGIVSRMRDPALLEFAGHQLLRSSVFPVEPGRTQAVRLTFEQMLTAVAGRLDWVLPRSEALSGELPWTVRVRLEAGSPIGAVFSPSQDLTEVRRDGRLVELRLDGRPGSGALRLGWTLRDREPIAAWAYPEGDGGVFAVLAEAPPPGSAAPIPREVTVVLDRSGSMAEGAWSQARRAVAQALAALAPEESANLLLFNEGVDAFAPAPVRADEAGREAMLRWLGAARPSGGTNLHEALAAAVARPARPGALPLVLLLTDGMPTIGVTSETAIRASIAGSSSRVFAIGVGHDVNAPLLDALVEAGRGRVRHLPPGADIELAVAELVRSLGRPVLAAPELAAEPGRVLDVQPRRLRDAFAGEQLLLCGRWAGSAPVVLRLAGTLADGARWERTVKLDPADADPLASWVPRLWAQRRLGELVQQARDLGADGGGDPARLSELTRDIVRLSTQYGILTEYTAFLATEGGALAQLPERGPPPAAAAPVLRRAADELRQRGLAERSGAASQASSLNNGLRREAVKAASGNILLGLERAAEAAAAVQQAAASSLWRRGSRWIEAGADGQPRRAIAFGSAEHLALAERLAAKGRQSLLARDGEIQLRDGADIVLIGAAP